MVLWPFEAKHCGLPTTVRDAGAWTMFAGTPYALRLSSYLRNALGW